MKILIRIYYMPWGGGGGSAGGSAEGGGALNSNVAGAAMGVIGNIINGLIAKRANKDAKQFWWDTHNQMRAENLADWNMQNEYNSPEQQMKRFEAAGLNRLLVTGGMGAMPSANVGSASGGNYTPRVPDVDPQGIMRGALDMAREQKQLEMIDKQMELMDHQATNVDANTRATLANAGLKEFELEFSGDTRDYRKQKVENEAETAENRRYITAAQVDLLNQDFEQKKIMNPVMYDQAVSKALSMVLDNKMAQLEIETVPLKREQLRAQISYLKSQGALTDIKKLLADIDLDYKPAEKVIGTISKAVSTVTGTPGKVLKSAMPDRGAGSKTTKAFSDALKSFNKRHH